MKKKPSRLLIKGAEYLLILLAGILAAAITHSSLIGDAVVIVLFGYISYSDLLQQEAQRRAERKELEEERLASALIAYRFATRINAELKKTLATDDYDILSLEQWSASRIAEWQETPQHPAPLVAWDVVVQVRDGSEPESLTIYVDTLMYTLPAASENLLQGQYD